MIERGLRGFDAHTWITTLLHRGRGGRWTALASMRAIQGHRKVPVAQSVGDPRSSVPTHALMQGFRYPALPGFDATRVTESLMFETTRLVVAKPAWVAPLVAAGELSADTAKCLLTAALAELIVSAGRLAQRILVDPPPAAWIFNVRPRFAVALRDFKGLELVPLYNDGAEPTPAALDSALDAPYFHRWRRELCRDLPPAVVQAMVHEGVAAAVRHVARYDVSVWQDRAVTLPFLLVHDAPFKAAINQMEVMLAQQPYRDLFWQAKLAHG